MSFLGVANSGIMYILVIIAIAYVFGLAGLFTRKSWGRAIELGMNKETLTKVIKSSLIFSIVPSIAIVIGLFALAPVLGVPWPWLRLSVIGSVFYELMSADIAAGGMGTTLQELAVGGNATALGNIMLVMTTGAAAWIIATMLVAKKITTSSKKMSSKSEFGTVAMSCFMLSMMVVFLPTNILKGTVNALTFFTSFAIAILLGFIIKKFKAFWLGDFVLAFCLIGGMVSSIMWTNILG